jgi:hypothetical protein
MGTDRRAIAFAIIAALPLIACDTPPQGVTSVTAWHEALIECRRYARLSGAGNGWWRDYDDMAGPEWRYVDPCMQAKGYPAPPPQPL